MQLLDDIRFGRNVLPALRVLRERCMRPLPATHGIQPTQLHSRNKEVDETNEGELAKLPRWVVYLGHCRVSQVDGGVLWARGQDGRVLGESYRLAFLTKRKRGGRQQRRACRAAEASGLLGARKAVWQGAWWSRHLAMLVRMKREGMRGAGQAAEVRGVGVARGMTGRSSGAVVEQDKPP